MILTITPTVLDERGAPLGDGDRELITSRVAVRVAHAPCVVLSDSAVTPGSGA